jgi:uncharacterized protein YaaR (DUF327 family)
MSIRVNHSDQSQTLNLPKAISAEKKQTNFSNILAHTEQLQRQELENFLKKLDSQGRKLAESMAIQDLIDFKNLIKRFLKSTLGQSRSMQEETLWDFRGQPKIMARVTRIDKALEELAEQVLSSQKEPLDILAKIDEIRGLIIDLLV